MQDKEEILNKIDQGDLYEVFAELNKCLGTQNEKLNALVDEFTNPPANFNIVQFNVRLKVFVNSQYKCSPRQRATEIDYYDLLCELDFKVQTENFQRIYPNKSIAAFLLHGETDEQGNDLKWLCRQLMYKEALTCDLVVDLSSVACGSYESLLREFYIRFGVIDKSGSKTKPMVQLRSRIEEKLQNEHLVCIVKGPAPLFNSETEIGAFFNEFLCYLDENIDKEKCENSLILIFIDDKDLDFPSKEPDYFLSFEQENESAYYKEAIETEVIKIIDLSPISKVQESDISSWIGAGMKRGKEVYSKIACYQGQEKGMLSKGSNPYQVIEQICKDLNVTIKDTWKI